MTELTVLTELTGLTGGRAPLPSGEVVEADVAHGKGPVALGERAVDILGHEEVLSVGVLPTERLYSFRIEAVCFPFAFHCDRCLPARGGIPRGQDSTGSGRKRRLRSAGSSE